MEHIVSSVAPGSIAAGNGNRAGRQTPGIGKWKITGGCL